MKRLLRIGFMVTLAMVFAAGTSFASGDLFNGVNVNGTVETVYAPQTAPTERIDASDGYALEVEAPAQFSGIGFSSDCDISEGQTVTIMLENATFESFSAPDSFALVQYDDAADAPLVISDFEPPAGSELTFNIEGGVLVGAGTPIGLAKVDTSVTPIEDGVLDELYNLVVDPSLAGTGGNVSVSVDVSGGDCADVVSTVFQTYQQQLMIVSLPGGNFVEAGQLGQDVIDAIDAERKSFVGSTEIADQARFSITTVDPFVNPDANWFDLITPGEIEAITLTLSGDFTGIDNPEEDIAVTNPGPAWSLSFDAAASELELANNLWSGGPKGFNIEVDGETVLNPRAWNLSAVIELAEGAGREGDINLPSTPIAEWIVNGYQTFLPMMRATADDTTRTFVKFVNTGLEDVEVFVDVIEEDGNTTTIQLADIPAGTTKMYWGYNIADQVGGVMGETFAARFTLTLPACCGGWDGPTQNSGARNIYSHAFLNVLSDGVWTTRNLTMYELGAQGGKKLK